MFYVLALAGGRESRVRIGLKLQVDRNVGVVD
jgi:hypothetical protein